MDKEGIDIVCRVISWLKTCVLFISVSIHGNFNYKTREKHDFFLSLFECISANSKKLDRLCKFSSTAQMGLTSNNSKENLNFLIYDLNMYIVYEKILLTAYIPSQSRV